MSISNALLITFCKLSRTFPGKSALSHGTWHFQIQEASNLMCFDDSDDSRQNTITEAPTIAAPVSCRAQQNTVQRNSSRAAHGITEQARSRGCGCTCTGRGQWGYRESKHARYLRERVRYSIGRITSGVPRQHPRLMLLFAAAAHASANSEAPSR